MSPEDLRRRGAPVTRRSVMIGIGSLALAACQGPRSDDVALGGDDAASPPAEGGVGGTGIIGTLTDAREPAMNGFRLAMPADLGLRDAFGATPRGPLAAGQTLTVEAVNETDDVLLVRSVTVVHPLIGPVDAVTADGFRTLGVDVAIEPGAGLVDAAGAPFSPAPGQRVAVSGLWRGEMVVASRVELLADGDGPDLIAGTVKRGTAPGAVRLGGLDLVLADGTPAPPLDSYATVAGRRNGPALQVDRIAEGRFPGFISAIDALSVEGYLEPIPAAPGYTISGLGHSFDDAARLGDLASVRALFVGPYDGTFVVAYGLPLPEQVAQRERILDAVTDGFAPENALRTR